jgi:hypothetical protein
MADGNFHGARATNDASSDGAVYRLTGTVFRPVSPSSPEEAR